MTVLISTNGWCIQCESEFIGSPLSEIHFLISLAWAEGGKDAGDPMLKIKSAVKGIALRPRLRNQKINSESFGFP